MSAMRNMAIRHKLILITMLTCITALLLAGAAFVAWEWTVTRLDMVTDLSIQAEMIADNCKAALAFEDAQDAEETLNALHAESSIVFGGVYDDARQIFAAYYRSDPDSSIHPSVIQQRGHYFDGLFLTVFKPVVLDNEEIGAVCLRSDLDPMYEMIKYNAGTVVTVLLLVTLAAYLISAKLQKIISGPILSLAGVAKAISEKKDYAARATSQSNDELGLLVSSFNEMLDQIQHRDLELVDAKGQLEVKVEKRTEELSLINTKLEGEVAERTLTQKTLQQHIEQLNCLYELSRLIERPDITLEQIFQETVELLRKAYRHSDAVCVRLTFAGIPYKTDNFEKSESSQLAQIKVRGEKTGTIEVYYLSEKIGQSKDLFSQQEHDLLNAVAEHLARIAERRQAGEKLQLFRNLIARSNDCIFVMEPEMGRFLDLNDRACITLGYTREELLNMGIRDIDDSILDDFSWQEHIKELKQKGDVIIQGRHKRKDRAAFPAETSLRLISRDKKSYIIAIARDITERKKAEERQKQLLEEVEDVNRELKDFAYVVSHDLKAPLRGIKTLADWLSTDYGDKLGEDGKEQMKLLLSRVDRMHNLIDGILQYSRVGRIKEEHVRVDLNEIVPAIIDLIAPPENIAVTVEDKLPVIGAEETRIAQVFQNLLSNAIKYMDKPQGRIKVGCAQENGFWKFSVSDNGPGIEQQYFEKIFKIFQTLNARDEFESTGVGLSVVKKIVEMYDGKIWVESEVGQGSTFFFTFPKQEIGVENAKHETNIVS